MHEEGSRGGDEGNGGGPGGVYCIVEAGVVGQGADAEGGGAGYRTVFPGTVSSAWVIEFFVHDFGPGECLIVRLFGCLIAIQMEVGGNCLESGVSRQRSSDKGDANQRSICH